MSFSRTVRASSPSSTRKYGRRRSITGSQVVVLPWDAALPSRTSQSRLRWERVISHARRDFPTPASPTSATT